MRALASGARGPVGVMRKQLKQHRWLQSLVRSELARHGIDHLIAPLIRPAGKAVWDEECEGLGRMSWTCAFMITDQKCAPPEIIASIRETVRRWQDRYDLGITAH